ncbi:MAG: hypothetical protein Q7I98_06655, partial [Erysipelotrichaceae bacterium]|nr:hypothetical protein [Erysipelotrichaceae bacterium]
MIKRLTLINSLTLETKRTVVGISPEQSKLYVCNTNPQCKLSISYWPYNMLKIRLGQERNINIPIYWPILIIRIMQFNELELIEPLKKALIQEG